ncbi:MAG: DUF2892 domain-containing protein [bacterium]
MKSNMGGADRIIRLFIGIIIIALGLYFHSWWGLVSLIFLFTAAFAWCPAYLPFKFSTKPKAKEAEAAAPPPPAQ